MLKFNSIIALIALSISHLAQADLNTGLVAYYPFNTNALDASGNGNDGTVYGATLTADRFGNANSAYSFDGNNVDEKRIEITNNSDFNFNNSFSVAFWYKHNSNGLLNRGIVGKWNYQGGNNQNEWVFVSGNNSTDKLAFHVLTTSQQYASTSSILIDNNWYFIIGIYDGQNIKIYLNEVLEGITHQSGNLINGTSNIGIGNYAWTEGTNNVIKGAIDDVRVYNRALTATEVAQLYQLEVAIAPAANTNAPSLITANSAILKGTVNDNGAATTVNFDLGATVSYGTTVAATPANIAAGTGNKVVTANKTGLTCNAVYHYRVKAVNSVGTTNGADQSFTTAACPLDLPVAVTSVATAVAATSATLNGSVTSKGATATASFELGTSTSYGETVTAIPAQIYSSAAVAVTASKTGLVCNTAYNFRTQAVSSTGTGLGANQTFTTLTCPVTSYTVTANANPLAGGSFISDPDTATVTAGSTKSFIVTANAGYIANQAVTGTCPQGTWGGISNNVWTTGLINANCTVIFGFTTINSWLNPPNQLVIPEQQFTLAIIVKSTSVKVGQYSFTLTFDPTKLGLDLTYPDTNCTVGVCPGTNALTTLSPPQVNSNTITLKGVDLQGIGPGNDLQLLVIHFKSLFINEEPSFVTGVSLKTNYLDTVSGSSIGLGARAANVIVRSGICGDADGNAAVNIVDALAIARQLVGMPPPPTVEDVLADVNEDGRVGITDALHIARYSIGLVTPPEVCAIGQAF